MEYTQQYEYAKSVMQSFIQAELTLERNQDLSHEQSAMFQLFTFDPAMMAENNAWNKLYKLMFSNEANNGFAVRLRACAIEIESSLGTEFVKQLSANTLNAIVKASYNSIAKCEGYVHNTHDYKYYSELDNESVHKVFKMCPWIWIIPLGHSVYRPTLLRLITPAAKES